MNSYSYFYMLLIQALLMSIGKVTVSMCVCIYIVCSESPMRSLPFKTVDENVCVSQPIDQWTKFMLVNRGIMLGIYFFLKYI